MPLLCRTGKERVVQLAAFGLGEGPGQVSQFHVRRGFSQLLQFGQQSLEVLEVVALGGLDGLLQPALGGVLRVTPGSLFLRNANLVERG